MRYTQVSPVLLHVIFFFKQQLQTGLIGETSVIRKSLMSRHIQSTRNLIHSSTKRLVFVCPWYVAKSLSQHCTIGWVNGKQFMIARYHISLSKWTNLAGLRNDWAISINIQPYGRFSTTWSSDENSDAQSRTSAPIHCCRRNSLYYMLIDGLCLITTHEQRHIHNHKAYEPQIRYS